MEKYFIGQKDIESLLEWSPERVKSVMIYLISNPERFDISKYLALQDDDIQWTGLWKGFRLDGLDRDNTVFVKTTTQHQFKHSEEKTNDNAFKAEPSKMAPVKNLKTLFANQTQSTNTQKQKEKEEIAEIVKEDIKQKPM